MSIVYKITSPEHEIALEQLGRLKDISKERLLSPEEVKMYDLLVKNLRLIENEPTTIDGSVGGPKTLTVEDALALMEPSAPKPKTVTRKKKSKK